jgi:hypothetical protein
MPIAGDRRHPGRLPSSQWGSDEAVEPGGGPLTSRSLGIGLMVAGVALIVFGLVWRAGSSAGSEIVAPATTGLSPTTEPEPTTETTARTQQSTTTAPPPPSTTTTANPPTTTTTAPPPSIEDFITAYAAATESANTDFLFQRLLPGIVDVLGADLCRGFVANEITAISDYRLTGAVSGPSARSLTVGDVQIDIDAYYEAPVSFTFQGQPFDATATFAVVDDLIYWIGECR